MMKISCLQENLKYGLSVVGKAAATRTSLPITNNILLATENSRLRLTATNLEMAITCWVGAKVEKEGKVTIPAVTLGKIAVELPDSLVEMEVSGNEVLSLTCGSTFSKISGTATDDFPAIPQVKSGKAIKINASDFRKAVSRVVFSAATDESRPILTGVFVEFSGKELILASADGFRLSVCKITLNTEVSGVGKIVIPARTLNEVLRLIGENDPDIEIVIDNEKNQVMFRLKEIEIVSNLLAGNFPPYNQLIPKEYTTKAILDTTAFTRGNRAARIFAEGSGIVKLELAANKMAISARAEEVGENKSEIEAAMDGPNNKIAFNGKYISDVLSVMHTSEVALEITNPQSPGILRPVGDSSYLHVIMPMFIQ